MKQKGFTLIELLVVVAIIGILAAVGVVAYSGYTTAAKAALVKSNHKVLVKYAANEFMKCEVGLVTDIFNDLIKCSERDGATVMGAFLPAARSLVTSNPYGNPNPAQTKDVGVIIDAAKEDKNVGYITVNYHFGFDALLLATCFKTPCNTDNDENILIDMFKTKDRD